MSSQPSIIVAAEDRERLLLLAQRDAGQVAEQLEVELGRARIVPLAEVPGDVVTMNSTLEVEVETTGQRRTLTLVYPHETDATPARVSILAPLGCALLGLRAGQSIDWQMPAGLRRLRVLRVER